MSMECVQWDAKNWGISYDQAVIAVNDARDDLLWFLNGLNNFRDKYLHKWVAIHKKSVLAANEDYDVLFAELKNKGVDMSTVQFEFVNEENYVQIY